MWRLEFRRLLNHDVQRLASKREPIFNQRAKESSKNHTPDASGSRERRCGKIHQASIPSGASTSRLNACISRAPSAPSMARWSKLPVALMMVAICRESAIT
jgi:hypothetical protein